MFRKLFPGRGRSVAGTATTDTHSSTPPPPPPPPASTEFCQYFMAGYCRNGTSCPNRHYVDGQHPPANDSFQFMPSNEDNTFGSGGAGLRTGTGSTGRGYGGSRSSDTDGGEHFHQMNSDMSQPDVDNMTYEQLLALEARMGGAEQVTNSIMTAVSRLPIIVYKAPESKKNSGDGVPPEGTAATATAVAGSTEGKTCSICLVEYDSGDSLILLPCFHQFHSDCGFQWFETGGSALCPVCKLDIRRSGSQLFGS
jgi:hypothetical protein